MPLLPFSHIQEEEMLHFEQELGGTRSAGLTNLHYSVLKVHKKERNHLGVVGVLIQENNQQWASVMAWSDFFLLHHTTIVWRFLFLFHKEQNMILYIEQVLFIHL